MKIFVQRMEIRDGIYIIHKMFTSNYKIADLNFSIKSDFKSKSSEGFSEFLTEANTEDVQILFAEVPQIQVPKQQPDYEGVLYQAFYEDCWSVRLYRDEKKRAFAFSRYDWNRHQTEVFYESSALKFFETCEQQFRYISFDAIMMSFKRLLFHSSLIETPYGGILFSGLSGIGKSTQAALWEANRGALQINGDRPILYKKNHKWMGSGSPYAGSSRCYVQKSIPIAAIVFLQKDKTCRVEHMRFLEAFKLAWEATVLNIWDRRYIELASNLVEQLVTEIPICRLCCTPDEEAVKTLESWLIKQQGGASNVTGMSS